MAASATWYLARLRAMEPREIVHRVIEKAKKLAWRNKTCGWSHFSSIGDGRLCELDFIRARLARSPGALDERTLNDLVQRIRDGDLELLGHRWPNSRPSAWHAGQPSAAFWLCDPVSGNIWPGADTYCFDINFRHVGTKFGDVKYVWELNRLQFLHPIAAKIAATGNAALARWAFRIVANWAEAHPPYRGINWASGIELSLRIVSFALLVAAVGPAAMEPMERKLVRRLIAAHGYWLHRYPSRYSSANNHLIAEGLGLFIAGILAPNLPDANRWVRTGKTILETETQRQILSDGVGAEQSPTYQAFTMEMVALAALVGQGVGEPLAPQVLERLAQGADYLGWLADAVGRVPAIGDDDEGRVIAQPPDREPRYTASIAAAIVGLMKRDGIFSPPHDLHIRDTLFSTPTSSRARQQGLRVFSTGGYSIVHDRMNGHAVDLVFDHGPLGYLSLAAHGHADALAVWLTIDDAPVFVDAGTYLYHSGGAMRDQLRETIVHNTLVLAGQSQSRITGPFMWGARATARITGFRPWPNWSISGEHDGYIESFGVRHLRRVEKQDSEILIFDRLDGAGQRRPVSIQFLCHPELTATALADGVCISRMTVPILAMTAPSNFRTEIIIGEQGTGRGWYSPRFGGLVPAPLVTFRGNLANQEATIRLKILQLPPDKLGTGNVTASR
jgi:hypothetical protein